MEDFEGLFEGESSTWLEVLPKFQKEIIDQLFSQGKTPEEAASAWLSAGPRDTYPFGVEKGISLFLEKVLSELEAFLCGDPKYKEDRSKLSKLPKESHAYFVGVISSAVAPVVGSSGAVLAPAIAILLFNMGKITLNAWCSMRKEISQNA